MSPEDKQFILNMKLLCASIAQALTLKNPEDFIGYVTNLITIRLNKPALSQEDLFISEKFKADIANQLNECENTVSFSNYSYKFYVIRKLRKAPLSVPRTCLELKAKSRFSSVRDMQSIVKSVVEETVEVLRLAGLSDPSKYLFKQHAISKVKRQGLIDGSRPSHIQEANVIYNTLLTLNKGNDVRDKDKLYIAIEELSAILHEIRPAKKNLIKNKITYEENNRLINETLSNSVIRLTGTANGIEARITSLDNVLERIDNYPPENNLHRSKNERVNDFYERKLILKSKLIEDLKQAKEELQNARTSLNNIKQANELLLSTIKQDRSLVIEAANELKDALTIHAGIWFKRSFIYNLNITNRNW